MRWDGGIEPGNEVTLYYDPLLAKLIVWGENREVAIQRMRRALLSGMRNRSDNAEAELLSDLMGVANALIQPFEDERDKNGCSHAAGIPPAFRAAFIYIAATE